MVMGSYDAVTNHKHRCAQTFTCKGHPTERRHRHKRSFPEHPKFSASLDQTAETKCCYRSTQEKPMLILGTGQKTLYPLFKISFIQKTDCIISSFFFLLGQRVSGRMLKTQRDTGGRQRTKLQMLVNRFPSSRKKEKRKKGVENATQNSKDLKKTSHNITRFLRGRNKH